ncbi:MAG: nucleotide exchange factor GrpE [Dehalococcoidia bacterium]|nr:MAG: nucleotide exchange factor GrpE [Dehalococcoidia bacterium]
MEEEKEETLELEAEDIDSLKKSLEEEKAKAERYLSNWQRAEADFNNYKKRADQERGEVARFANIALVLNLLPVLDDLERAFNSLPATLAQLTWIDGIRLIHRKLQAILEAQGLSEIKTVGESFDPTVHEAVSQGEGEEGKVIEELQKGYKLHDRVIRPALVVVGKGKEEEKEEKKEEKKPDESVD